jgi:hypothetical protein
VDRKLQLEKINDNAVNTGLIRSVYDVGSTSNDSGSPMILSSISLSVESLRSPMVWFYFQIISFSYFFAIIQGLSIKEQLLSEEYEREETEEDKESVDRLMVNQHYIPSSSRSFSQPREFHVRDFLAFSSPN